jgi:hypothetical protein
VGGDPFWCPYMWRFVAIMPAADQDVTAPDRGEVNGAACCLCLPCRACTAFYY